MAGFDELAGRLASDAAFAAEVVDDPARVLVGYELTVDELTAVAQLVEPATALLAAPDQRRSRAAFFALLTVARESRTTGPGVPGGLPARP